MPDATWKAAERRIAKRLGGRRNPLSGIRSGAGTHGDLIHETLYGEFKHLKKAAILSLHADTRKKAKAEGKIPITIIHGKGTQQYAVTLDLADFELIWNLLRELATCDRHSLGPLFQLQVQARKVVGGRTTGA